MRRAVQVLESQMRLSLSAVVTRENRKSLSPAGTGSRKSSTCVSHISAVFSSLLTQMDIHYFFSTHFLQEYGRQMRMNL